MSLIVKAKFNVDFTLPNLCRYLTSRFIHKIIAYQCHSRLI